MMIVEPYIYQGVYFRLLPTMVKKKSAVNILAQGGSYESLIQLQR